jgi:hypothetical protein
MVWGRHASGGFSFLRVPPETVPPPEEAPAPEIEPYSEETTPEEEPS